MAFEGLPVSTEDFFQYCSDAFPFASSHLPPRNQHFPSREGNSLAPTQWWSRNSPYSLLSAPCFLLLRTIDYSFKRHSARDAADGFELFVKALPLPLTLFILARSLTVWPSSFSFKISSPPFLERQRQMRLLPSGRLCQVELIISSHLLTIISDVTFTINHVPHVAQVAALYCCAMCNHSWGLLESQYAVYFRKHSCFSFFRKI